MFNKTSISLLATIVATAIRINVTLGIATSAIINLFDFVLYNVSNFHKQYN